MPSRYRVPYGWEYWEAHPNPFHFPYTRRRIDMRTEADDKIWDEGRYFLCYEDAKSWQKHRRECKRRPKDTKNNKR